MKRNLFVFRPDQMIHDMTRTTATAAAAATRPVSMASHPRITKPLVANKAFHDARRGVDATVCAGVFWQVFVGGFAIAVAIAARGQGVICCSGC